MAGPIATYIPLAEGKKQSNSIMLTAIGMFCDGGVTCVLRSTNPNSWAASYIGQAEFTLEYDRNAKAYSITIGGEKLDRTFPSINSILSEPHPDYKPPSPPGDESTSSTTTVKKVVLSVRRSAPLELQFAAGFSVRVGTNDGSFYDVLKSPDEHGRLPNLNDVGEIIGKFLGFTVQVRPASRLEYRTLATLTYYERLGQNPQKHVEFLTRANQTLALPPFSSSSSSTSPPVTVESHESVPTPTPRPAKRKRTLVATRPVSGVLESYEPGEPVMTPSFLLQHIPPAPPVPPETPSLVPPVPPETPSLVPPVPPETPSLMMPEFEITQFDLSMQSDTPGNMYDLHPLP